MLYQYIGIILFLVLYFTFAPMVNDEACVAFAETSPATFKETAGQILILCWTPWN